MTNPSSTCLSAPPREGQAASPGGSRPWARRPPLGFTRERGSLPRNWHERLSPAGLCQDPTGPRGQGAGTPFHGQAAASLGTRRKWGSQPRDRDRCPRRGGGRRGRRGRGAGWGDRDGGQAQRHLGAPVAPASSVSLPPLRLSSGRGRSLKPRYPESRVCRPLTLASWPRSEAVCWAVVRVAWGSEPSESRPRARHGSGRMGTRRLLGSALSLWTWTCPAFCIFASGVIV